MKVLIVDDDFVSRSLMQTIMANHGVSDPDVVVSGHEAIEAYKISLQKEEPYELIFMDVVMPSQSGLKVMHEIREMERDSSFIIEKPVKIIVVSSLDDPAMVMEAFRESCDHYVIKPISEEKVLTALEKAKVKGFY